MSFYYKKHTQDPKNLILGMRINLQVSEEQLEELGSLVHQRLRGARRGLGSR